ncbi:MAG: hypothetical protein GXY58_10065 [Planctomycetaceae bacterium]|nr:hypothetical protein [Planctomycetaceae bacterium]
MSKWLRYAVAAGTAVLWASALAAQVLAPAGLATWPDAAPGLADAVPHVRLPETNWQADDESTLPPPPGWMTAELASLGTTLGSAPPFDPLDPGDELTMETGRIASHRNGFFQKLSLSGAWLDRGGDEDFGMVEARSFVTVALPLPTRDFPLLITSGFDATPLDGPRTPHLPPRLYDAYLDLMWLPKITDRWMGILAVTPGVYSDFDNLQGDAYRTKGKALVRCDWVPGRVQVLAGVLYLSRFTFNWLPAGGVIWDPHDDVHLEIVFPRPLFAYRFTASALHEDWVYVAGEFGGDTYSVRNGMDSWDMIEIVDWRVYAGIERKKPGGGSVRCEVGYVFSRNIEFESPIPDYKPADTLMVRAGFDF